MAFGFGHGAPMRRKKPAPIVVVPPDAASALPAANSDVATVFQITSNRYSMSGVVVPAGDHTWGWYQKTNAHGCVWNLGPTTLPHTSNNTITVYGSVEGVSVSGKDGSGNVLALSASSPANSTARGFSSTYVTPFGIEIFCFLRKIGNFFQLWVKWPGHAAVLAAEEYTNFGAATHGLYVGKDRSASFIWQGAFRRFFKVSYALTESQMNSVAEGADPTTFGTPAANDFFFASTPAGSTWTSTINGIQATASLAGYGSTTLGNAPLAQGVYLKPEQPGRVFQRGEDNRATIPLSGWYAGSDAPIQVLPIDWATNVSVGNWTTVDPAPTGGFWSGSISLPARAGWYKFQMRKVIGGVPSTEVMTSNLRFGVGEVVMLIGQSGMQNIGSAEVLGGSGSDVTANGLWSTSENSGYLIGSSATSTVAINNVTNVGGLIQCHTTNAHGRARGHRGRITGVVGVPANGEWSITPTGPSTFTLDGSVFSGAYVSGGQMHFVVSRIRIANNTYNTVPAGHAVIGNYLSEQAGCPVMIINRAVGGQAIEYFSSYDYAGVGTGASLMVLHAKFVGKIGTILLLHGSQNIGSNAYFSDSGSVGAWSGWGLLGAFYDFANAEFPNNDFKIGVAPFIHVAGKPGPAALTVHNFRHGIDNWIDRKIAAGDTRVFRLGYFNDLQPVAENVALLQTHLDNPNYRRYAARMPHAYAAKLGAVANDSTGPRIVSASRSGAIITLTVQHNGGTNLRVLREGARPSGFEVSANDFATKLPISSITLGASSIIITLASNPGGPVKVRHQYGFIGDYTEDTWITPKITNATNNGSGAIRITCAVVDVTPVGSQFPGGHGLVNGQWILIQGLKGTVEANGIWQVAVIDPENFDLVGSTFVNAFVSGTPSHNAAFATVVTDVGVPIYDNRTIGGYDTNGAPLQPTATPLIAA